ncbi:MAG: hypothetical protein WC511_02830 [Candidatus Pacearchaeota archaeon]
MYRLRIVNFQSIADLTIDFEDSKFYTFVGETNRGKTAIIRALRAVFYNEWNESYLRHGTKECILSLEVMNKSPRLIELFPNFNISKIVLKKPENSYTLYFDDGTSKVYPKVGKEGVPEVFADLALKEVETERGDFFNLNFRGQLDKLFLITATDVEATSFLNKVFDISRFERALRELKTDSIKKNKALKEHESNLIVLGENKKVLEDSVQDLEIKSDTLEKTITSVEASLAVDKRIKASLQELQNIAKELEVVVESKKQITPCRELKNLFQILAKDLQKLGNLKHTRISVKQEIEQQKAEQLRVKPLAQFHTLLFTVRQELQTMQKTKEISVLQRQQENADRGQRKYLPILRSILSGISVVFLHKVKVKESLRSLVGYEENTQQNSQIRVATHLKTLLLEKKKEFKTCPLCNNSLEGCH